MFEIKWTKRQSDYFIQGTELCFFEEEVHWKNPLVSPGATVVKWDSEASYGVHRTALQLPLLERGAVYRIASNLEATPEDSVAIKFSVFDRTSTLINTQLLPLRGGEVTYLDTAYSYTIELISTGVEHLCFRSITLEEKGGEA